MGPAPPRRPRIPVRLPLFACVLLAATLASGCGGAVSNTSVEGGSASVTFFATSTANDQLSEFNITLNSVTLTGSSGKTVTVFDAPLSAEFIHLNGQLEPLTTVSIPEDVYTSGAAEAGTAGFECMALDPEGALIIHGFNYGVTPTSAVTLNLPEPITVGSAAMGISLDLLVSRSASWTTCGPEAPGQDYPYSITPTLNLAAVTFSSNPTNEENGQAAGLGGLIASVDAAAGSLTVTAPGGGPIWSVLSGSGTQYQGAAGISDLAVGMAVDMDLVSQASGSLLATRVAVLDTNATDLSLSSGPVEVVVAAWPAMFADEVEEQGFLPGVFGYAPFSFGGAEFQASGQLTNLQALPFTPSFSAADIVAGQIVSVTTHAAGLAPAPTYEPATTITLLPQTINGTVSAIGSEGGFTTYTVTLAPYDLFPALAVQPGQTTLLTSPNTVVVYADSNTQMLNTSPVAVGGVARFYGLVFNDNGTLRMDCAQINDGVAE